MKATALRIGFFIAVGCAAAAVHLAMVVLLVSVGGWQPLVANIVGWFTAFFVSFAGHRLLTFRERTAPLLRAMVRMFGISLGGFAINEATYAVMLYLTGMRYDVVLAIVLVVVAVMTYLLSSRWAFLGIEPR